MSSEQNTLYPALRQLATAVLAAYQPAPCEGCQGQPTTPYVIAFGKQTGSSSTTSGNTTTTITTYHNLAARAVSLCPACIDAHRKEWLRKLTTWLVGVIIFTLVCIGAVIVGGEQVRIFGAGFGTVGAIIVLILFVQRNSVRTNDVKVGQSKALRLHLDSLKAAGYDTFWTDEVA